jgi:UDP-2,4-diacetamido-2,4,6-trideoxy-beta-L-altropyranose hydrolase
MNNSLLFMTEAGDKIGFGHLMRMQAIQAIATRTGYKTDFFLQFIGNPEKIYSVGKIINWREEIKRICGLSHQYQIVLIDSYLADFQLYEKFANCFSYVAAIDDYRRINYPVDLVINPNLAYRPEQYFSQTAKVTGGNQYVILRPEFLHDGQRYRVQSQIQRILVTLGGSDYRQLAPKILTWLQQENIEVIFIAGNEEYRRMLLGEFPKIEILGYVNVHEMIQIMTSVDLAISAAGQTLNELAYLGVPTIGICIDDDQVPNLDAFYQAGFLQYKNYWNDEKLTEKLAKQKELLTDQGFREQVSKRSRQLIQGTGAEEIINLLSVEVIKKHEK